MVPAGRKEARVITSHATTIMVSRVLLVVTSAVSAAKATTTERVDRAMTIYRQTSCVNVVTRRAITSRTVRRITTRILMRESARVCQ